MTRKIMEHEDLIRAARAAVQPRAMSEHTAPQIATHVQAAIATAAQPKLAMATTGSKTAIHVQAAIATAAQPKLATANSSPTTATHVQAAIAIAAQPKLTMAVTSPKTATHVQAATATAAQPRLERPESRLAAHVQRALAPGRQQLPIPGQPKTLKNAGQFVVTPLESSTTDRKPASVVVQRMKRKRSHTIDILDYPIGNPSGNLRKKRRVYYDEDGESDEETMINSIDNLGLALRKYKNYVAKVNKKKPPKRKIKKQTHTEAIGEALAMSRMLGDSGIDWKIGLETGVQGGPGIDQIWYEGSLSGDTITKIAIVEAKGPGASLGRGYGFAQMSDNWIDTVLGRMSRSTNSNKKSWGKLILKTLKKKSSTATVYAYVIKTFRNNSTGNLTFNTRKRVLKKSSTFWG